MWCVPPWLYLLKSVSVSSPLVAAGRGSGVMVRTGSRWRALLPSCSWADGAAGGTTTRLSKRGSDQLEGVFAASLSPNWLRHRRGETYLNHHLVYFGLVAPRWSHRQLYFSHIVAKQSLALRSRYSAETTWTSHTRGRVADVCSDHEWVSVFHDNDPI